MTCAELPPVPLGYVGAGFMAQQVHLSSFTSLPGCRLRPVGTRLAERRADLGRRVQARHGIPRLYSSHEELLDDPEVEAVAVSAAYSVQGAIARDCLLRGKPVFMEKPMTTSVEQAEEILAAERAGGGRLMVGYMKRYDAGNEAARQWIDRFRDGGELGELIYVRCHGFCGDWTAGLDVLLETSAEPLPPAPVVVPHWLPPEHASRYLAYLQQYTHNVNLLRWLLDAGDRVCVRAVGLDPDGYTGLVVFDMDGTRAMLESGALAAVQGSQPRLSVTARPMKAFSRSVSSSW